MRKIVVILVSFVLLSGCKDQESKPQITFLESGVMIANQGNFGWGEGTLTLYNPDDNTVQNDVFQNINDKSLGNVFQSITRINGLYYFVINNSGKIIVTDSAFLQIGQIDGLISPRYLYPITDTKAYVTDLYADAISVIDLNLNKVTKSIPVKGWSEKGVVKGDIFWFTAAESNKIYGVDINTDNVIDSLDVGNSPESIVLDNSDRIWVICKGDKDMKAMLVRFDISDESAEFQIELENTPTGLVFDQFNNVLYFLNNGLWSMKPNETLPNLIYDGEGKTFYALEINPSNGDLYVSDIVDFVSNSSILRFDKNGELINQFYAGIIAGDFFFQ